MITDKNDRFANLCAEFVYRQKWSQTKMIVSESELLQGRGLNTFNWMQLVQEEWRCINQRKNIVSSSNSIQNVLIWQIMHFSVQLSTFCVPKPTRQAPIFSELNSRHKNTRDVTFEKLEVRLQTKMITDKNDRWSAKLIVYRQKWSIIYVCGYCSVLSSLFYDNRNLNISI